MKINNTVEIAKQIDLNKTLEELRKESSSVFGNRLEFERFIEMELGIHVMNDIDEESYIYIQNNGGVNLYIKRNIKVNDVLMDLENYIDRIEDIKYFNEEKAGRLAPFIKSRINKKEKYFINLMD